MQLDLSGHHALVCGASQGIGRACALELAGLGANVILLARNADALQAVVDELPRKANQQHRWLSADMRHTDALRDAVCRIAADTPVTVLVNNSGGPPGGPIHAAENTAFEDAFRQHVLAAQTCVQALLPGMRACRYGRIVNIISTSVKEPLAGLGVSNTVRAATAAWAKTMAGELAADGITVNNVLPGYTRTARLDSVIATQARNSGQSKADAAKTLLAAVPARRFGEASEVAAMVAFLCTPAAAYVNGTSIAVDGGRTRSLS